MTLEARVTVDLNTNLFSMWSLFLVNKVMIMAAQNVDDLFNIRGEYLFHKV